jgi:hypothetical protein
VHVSTGLPEEVLRSVVSFVEERFNKHEKAAGDKLDDSKKIETLIITLLDVAAELFSARQEIRKFKQSDNETFAAFDTLNKALDEFSEVKK